MAGERDYNEFGLNQKQEEFCQQFIIDLNATQAAIRAGYSEKSAREIASKMLTNDHIQRRISDLKAIRSQRTTFSQDKVLREYAKIAFSDPRDYYDEKGVMKMPCNLSDDAAAALSSIEMGESNKIRLHDKVRALDALGKHLGIFEKDNAQKKTDMPSIEKLSEIAEKINKNAAG